jgi:hypothetical protein
MLLFVTVPAVTATGNFDKYMPSQQTRAVVWEDDFDSYTNGQSLHGVGGWTGWDNQSSATAYVTDLYNNSPPNSVDIYDISDLVYQFSDLTSGTWTLSCNMFIPSATFSGETWFIMLTHYEVGLQNWGLQIGFDSISNKLTSDPDNAQLDMIYDEWVEIRVEVNLEDDVQKVYYGGDLLVEKSWTEGVSGGGDKCVAALDLWGNNAESVYYDDFVMEGEAAADPEIVIGEVTGGIGVTAEIKNIGEGDAQDVEWSIALDGGLIILGKTAEGTIPSLAAGATTEVKTGLVFGFGRPTINITADAAAAEKSALVLLFLVLGIT